MGLEPHLGLCKLNSLPLLYVDYGSEHSLLSVLPNVFGFPTIVITVVLEHPIRKASRLRITKYRG